MRYEKNLTTKSEPWVDIQSSKHNILLGSGRAVEKSRSLLQIEKAAESSDGDLLCHLLRLEDAIAHLITSDPCEISTIEK